MGALPNVQGRTSIMRKRIGYAIYNAGLQILNRLNPPTTAHYQWVRDGKVVKADTCTWVEYLGFKAICGMGYTVLDLGLLFF